LGLKSRSRFSQKGAAIAPKLDKTLEIVNRQLCKDWDAAYKVEFEKEMKTVGELAGELFEWAAGQGLIEVKIGDLNVFLMEKGRRIIGEVQIALMNQANLKLRTQ
jgi:hypothetical protein